MEKRIRVLLSENGAEFLREYGRPMEEAGMEVLCTEKDGGRLICSRGLDTFIETQIDEEDIITALHPDELYDDRKYILFDDFKVWDKNGRCLGVFNRSLLPLLKLVS